MNAKPKTELNRALSKNGECERGLKLNVAGIFILVMDGVVMVSHSPWYRTCSFVE